MSVIDGRRAPPAREPSCGTDRPEGVTGVSNFPSEVDFDIGNTTKDCGRPREAAVGVPGVEFTADICFMWEFGERRFGDLLGDRGTSIAPEFAACRCCGEAVLNFVAEGRAMDRLLCGFITESLGRSVDGFEIASFRLSLVWTTPPPHRSTKSYTELCLPLCLGPGVFSADLDTVNPTASSGVSSSLEDILPSRGDSNVGCAFQSSEEGRSREERVADSVSES